MILGPESSRIRKPSGAPLSWKRGCRQALTIIELMVAVAIVGILIALLLTGVSSAREAARRMECSNHQRQIGLGLHAYHDVFSTFPAGYVADLPNQTDGGSWGWGALLLPFIEQDPLSNQLDTMKRSFDDVAMGDASRFMQTNVSLYQCPSDPSEGLSHRFRSVSVPLIVTQGASSGFDRVSPRGHLLPRRRKPRNPTIPVPPPTLQITVAIQIAKSNYIGSYGSQWKSQRSEWNDRDFRGNGLFGRNSNIGYSAILDGTSNTLAVGERSIQNYAAVWAGSNSWQGCGFADNQMVLGTAFYPLNDLPISSNIDCDGQGSANFSSYHTGGANFLYADGSVHFLSQHMDSEVYRNLAQRNDGENTSGL